MASVMMRCSALCLVAAIPVLSHSDGQAQPLDTTRTAVQGPRLGKHLFSPVVPLNMPLVRTNTQISVGAGTSTGIRMPEIEIGDRLVVAPSGNLLVAIGIVRHEQAIKNWFSVHGEVDVVGRLGTNVVSLLEQGVNTAVAFELGWKVRLIENDEWALSTGLALRDGVYSTVDVERWARGLLDSGYVTPDNQLVDAKPALSLKVPIQAAWTVSAAVGLYGAVEVGYAESRIRTGSPTGMVNAYAVLSTDWNYILDVPIGTALGLSYLQIPEAGESGDGATKNVSLRFGYTGDDAFSLGAQAILQFAPIAGVEDEVTFVTAGVDIRIYF